MTEWLASLVGAPGNDGQNGLSAYELALQNGYDGTLQDWLASLVGAAGNDGQNGADGKDGLSAYELAQKNGYEGSLTDWIASLAGRQGEKGEKGDTGTQGEKGETGAKGADGRGIAKTEIVDGELVITYTDGTKENVDFAGNTNDNSDLIFVELSDGTCSVQASEKAKDKTTITIPETHNGKPITVIEEKAFYQFENLTEISIPNTVKQIGKGAFQECSNLATINLPFRLTTIAENAFFGCSKINSVVIPDNVSKIGYSAFQGCTSLSKVTLPSNLDAIAAFTFYGCSALTDITIPAKVINIYRLAFYETSLTTATFENPYGWRYMYYETGDQGYHVQSDISSSYMNTPSAIANGLTSGLKTPYTYTLRGEDIQGERQKAFTCKKS